MSYIGYKDKDARREYMSAYHKRMKRAAIHGLGGRCACCGEDREELLSIDHVGGRESKIRLHGWGKNQSGKTYRQVVRMGFPKDIFRVLCFNCNCSIGFHGYCPHTTEFHVEGLAC